MIEVDCIQGSEEWFAAKLGIPSSSMFGKIVTPGGKPSTSARGYMNQLLADWLAGRNLDAVEANYWMDRGTEMEDTARNAYSFEKGVEVRQVGFIYLDDRQLTGASPDGLLGDDGYLEIKCPKASTMVDYYLGGFPSKYKPQIQGGLWISGRQWCDFYAHHPELYPYETRVERDDKYIEILSELVEDFITKMLTARDGMEQWRVS